jgi:hypothetical protein
VVSLTCLTLGHTDALMVITRSTEMACAKHALKATNAQEPPPGHNLRLAPLARTHPVLKVYALLATQPTESGRHSVLKSAKLAMQDTNALTKVRCSICLISVLWEPIVLEVSALAQITTLRLTEVTSTSGFPDHH